MSKPRGEPYTMYVKAIPLQMVDIIPLDCRGRVVSVRLVDSGAWYSVDYFMEGQQRNAEVHSDDIEI